MVTKMNRRKFLQGLSCHIALAANGLASSPFAIAGKFNTTKLHNGLFASSRKCKNKKHEAVIFSPQTGDIHAIQLPGRAHDIAAHPHHNEVVAVARRPGRFLAVFSPDKDKETLWLSSAKGRHFQGHGVYSPDGKLFYTSENDYDGESGVIGLRDVERNYRQIGEFPSYGIGVHEINIHPDGKTLIVANGGILTHPDTGRMKLNLRDMKPSLAYIDSTSGKLIEKQSLPTEQHQLSIRHFATSPSGTTIFGCQYQGDRTNRPALIGFSQMGETPVMIEAPSKVHRRMQNYVGSVAIDKSGATAATSSPQGNLIAFWDLENQKYLSHITLPDGCGLAPTDKKDHYLISNGHGIVIEYNVRTSEKKPSVYADNRFQWDNHILPL